MTLSERAFEAGVDRLLDQRVAQGLPRVIDDVDVLDEIAALVVGSLGGAFSAPASLRGSGGVGVGYGPAGGSTAARVAATGGGSDVAAFQAAEGCEVHATSPEAGQMLFSPVVAPMAGPSNGGVAR